MMPLLFNTLFRFVIAFLPRSKGLLISWLKSPYTVILEPKKTKSVTVSTFFPSICHEMMGLDAMIFVFECSVLIIDGSNRCGLVAKSWSTLGHPMDCSPPGSSVHVILQARILEWVVISSSRGSLPPRDGASVSGVVGEFFANWTTREV